MISGVEEIKISDDYLRGIKTAYRTIIAIIEENPLLSKNDIKLIVERQLTIEENN
jgi:hypothetical protein